MYLPLAQNPASHGTLVVRTRTTQPAGLASSLVAAIHELDRDLPVVDVMPMEAVVARATSDTRVTMILLALLPRWRSSSRPWASTVCWRTPCAGA